MIKRMNGNELSTNDTKQLHKNVGRKRSHLEDIL